MRKRVSAVELTIVKFYKWIYIKQMKED